MDPGAGAGQPKSADPLSDKSRLRVPLLAARARRARDPLGDSHRNQAVLDACHDAAVVAAYVSRPDEPDTADLLAMLHRAGLRILLPVLTREPDWAWYDGAERLAPGPLGISQPTGDRLGAAALGHADWIWLPGLAGTRSGDRLGTGGGWYDRALPFARTDARRGLLLFDEEVLDTVPVDPWDQRVDMLITDRRVVTCRDHGVE